SLGDRYREHFQRLEHFVRRRWTARQSLNQKRTAPPALFYKLEAEPSELPRKRLMNEEQVHDLVSPPRHLLFHKTGKPWKHNIAIKALSPHSLGPTSDRCECLRIFENIPCLRKQIFVLALASQDRRRAVREKLSHGGRVRCQNQHACGNGFVKGPR